jgi:hypothetical protein
MIFKDELLQLGEEGGRRAAKELSFAVENYVADNFPTIISPKIVTKMYVNMKALCDACIRIGVVMDPSLLDEFVRGFNSSFPLFDLIDVGTGKNAAHDKIKGMQCTCSSRFALTGCRYFRRDLQITPIQLPLSPDFPRLFRRIAVPSDIGRDISRHGAFRSTVTNRGDPIRKESRAS